MKNIESNKRQSTVLLDTIKKVVYSILGKEKLLQSEFHFGKVNQVISNKQLSVFVDGDTTAINISCNPDITFNLNDNVIVIYINNDPKNKYCLARIEY